MSRNASSRSAMLTKYLPGVPSLPRSSEVERLNSAVVPQSERACPQTSPRLPLRPDRPRHPRECAFRQLRHQQSVRIDGARHAGLAFGNPPKTCPGVVGLVADQHDQTVALAFCLRECALHQGKPDATSPERRLDRQRTEQQCRDLADADRRQPHGADQQGADPRREGELNEVSGTFANPERSTGVAPGPERALVKPLDGVGIGGRFWENREGKFGHRRSGTPDIIPRPHRPSGRNGSARSAVISREGHDRYQISGIRIRYLSSAVDNWTFLTSNSDP